MEEYTHWNSNVFCESIYKLFKELSILQLKSDYDVNKVIVFKQSYETKYAKNLQKSLYKTLYTELHCPIIIPTDRIQFSKVCKDHNVFFELAKASFQKDMRGAKEDARRLQYLTDCLAERKEEILEKVLTLFHHLSEPEKSGGGNNKQLVYVKDEFSALERLFQLDNKAMKFHSSAVNLFGR